MSRIAEQLVVPIERVDVEDQRAAGVAVVGHVAAAAGQPPDEPTYRRCRRGFRRAAARPRRPVDRVEQVLDLRAGEIGVEHQAGLVAKESARSPSALSRSQIGALTRLCQTMALATGRPVARSQRMVVSRWLVTPMAAMSAGRQPGAGQRLAGPRRAATTRSPRDRARPVPGRRQNLLELLLGRRPRRGRRGRRRSPGSTWCPDREPGCIVPP